MSSDQTMSIISQERMSALLQQMKGGPVTPSYRAMIDYFSEVDPAIAASRYALLPAKSVEFGKVDQPMLNHVRNGIWALAELNEALIGLDSSAALTYEQLRQAIALYAIHDLHKCVGRNWKEQFDISAELAQTVAAEFCLIAFAPELTAADYQSVCVALHAERGYHDEVSPLFTDLLRWLRLADALASHETPVVTVSMQKALDAVDAEMAFYYHRFQESTGILSNLVHTGVAEWMKRRGLCPILVYETGVLYVGPRSVDLGVIDQERITEIYTEFEHVLNSCHAAIADPLEFSKSITVQGSKGLYSVEAASFFYSGIPTVIKGFMAAAVLREERENKIAIEVDLATHEILAKKAKLEMQHPPLEFIDIHRTIVTRLEVDDQAVEPGDVQIVCRSFSGTQTKYLLTPESVLVDGRHVAGRRITIEGTGLLPSQVGYRNHIREDFGIDIGWDASIISYARAIAGLRKAIIDPLAAAGALPTTDPILETCRLFGIDEEPSKRMAEYARDHRGNDHHAVGGFWNYGYVIARLLLDSEINGIRFRNLPESERIEYLMTLADLFLIKITESSLETFKSKLLYPYREKLLVWIAENLDLNGSMAYGVFENKVSKFDAYCRGKGICRLTGDTPFDNEEKVPSIDSSMLGFSFSNRAVLGGTEPKLSVSVPVEIELGLRGIGHRIKKGSDKLYFRLIPDYFHTPLVARVFSDLLSRFNHEAMTNTRALALRVLNSAAIDPGSLAKDLFAENGGRPLFRYTATEFTGFAFSLYTTYDVVFNKVKDNETEYWFFGAYLGMLLATVTGCRVVVGDNPICMTSGDHFNEMILLEAPHAAVKRVFHDRIPLSDLPRSLRTASLLVALGYEYKPKDKVDDKYFPKHLQTLRNFTCPGSTLLKQLWRMNSKSEGKKGGFINQLRGQSSASGAKESDPVRLLDWGVELDQIAGDHMTVQTLHDLARLGIDVAVPKGYEPHKIERLFRESVKAILTRGTQQYQRDDYVDAVMGRLLKMMRRSGEDQFYNLNGLYHPELTQTFAETFVDHVFIGLFAGNSGKMKRAENDLADGYYAATLQLRQQWFATRSAERAAQPEQNQAVATEGED